MITRITVFGIALVVMIGAAAQAQEDFSRPGFYVGTGLALGVEAWDNLLAMAQDQLGYVPVT